MVYGIRQGDTNLLLLLDALKVACRTVADCKSRPDRIALQYWFHYFFDDKQSFPVNADHEGDWEMITVFLDKNSQEPIGAALSQHFKGRKLKWSKVQKTEDAQTQESTRPIIYIANGSHANSPWAGEFEVCLNLPVRLPLVNQEVCPPQFISEDIASGDGLTLSPGTGYEFVSLPRLTEISSSSPESWLLFSGKWGVRDINNPIGGPPDTPSFNGLNSNPLNNNPKWLDPCEWASNLPNIIYTTGTENILGAVVDVVSKIDSRELERDILISYDEGLGDMAIDPYGVLYIASDNGVKRVNADSATQLGDVGLNIPAPASLAIDEDNNVYVNTDGPFYPGIWTILNGEETQASQVIHQGEQNAFRFGRGMDFLKDSGHLIAASRNLEHGAPSNVHDKVIRAPVSGTSLVGEQLFIDLSSNGPFGEQQPVGVAVNSKGEVFVSITKVIFNSQMQQYEIVNGEGKILKFNPSGGNGVIFANGLYAPQYIAFDMDDNLYVSDPSLGVYMFTPEGIKIDLVNVSDANGIEVE